MILLGGLARAAPEYVVTLNHTLDQISVRACYNEGLPGKLHAASQLQQNLHSSFWLDGQRIRPRLRGESIFLNTSARCFRYSVDLQLTDGESGWRRAYRVGGDIVTKPQHWLIQPRNTIRGEPIQLRFELPPGIAVSTPWREREDPLAAPRNNGDETVYRVGLTPANWDAQIAFGRFDIIRVPVANTYLRLAVLDSRPRVDIEETRQWVREAALATLSVHGRFPQPTPQVLIVPVGQKNEPVPFARVVRGGGIGLQFFIDPTRSRREFSQDWTATHEFSHLLLPYISRRDAWLSEGLASYMQNVLRARDGRLTERSAWSKLHAGFKRGMRGASEKRTLADESRATSGRWNTMRVYWGGAAIWFLADVELRRRTQGRQTVDRALAGLQSCCMDPGKLWRARDMMRELDRITGESVFIDLYQLYSKGAEFPPVEYELERIGVDTRQGRVRLSDYAAGATIRTAIMSKNSATKP